MKIVIALGGNAILKKGEKPTIETQERNTERALKKLFPLIKKNKVVITHGNGPQVGYLLLQQKNMPLDVIDAETEGQIGYLIQQDLLNLFRKNGVKRGIVTVLTQVLVDKKDRGFRNPEKFIGPFYRDKKSGVRMMKDPRGGWRRVVASPKPIKIIEEKAIERLLRDNNVVIAAGGGGIPVIWKKQKKEYDGIEAVIDKDLASACLANSIKADELVMVTDVDSVYLNYGKPRQKRLEKVGMKEIKEYSKKGHFPSGNMGPKIEAAINFLSKRGKTVWIGSVEGVGKKDRGTVIVR
jgi:carbamate kinase